MKKSSLDSLPNLLNEGRSNAQSTTAGALVRSSAPIKQANEYVMLKKIIKEEGLFKNQPLYYTYKLISILGLMALSIVFLVTIHSFWFQLLNAILLAVASA